MCYLQLRLVAESLFQQTEPIPPMNGSCFCHDQSPMNTRLSLFDGKEFTMLPKVNPYSRFLDPPIDFDILIERSEPFLIIIAD